jgi:hypothetical protein
MTIPDSFKSPPITPKAMLTTNFNYNDSTPAKTGELDDSLTYTSSAYSEALKLPFSMHRITLSAWSLALSEAEPDLEGEDDIPDELIPTQ